MGRLFAALALVASFATPAHGQTRQTPLFVVESLRVDSEQWLQGWDSTSVERAAWRAALARLGVALGRTVALETPVTVTFSACHTRRELGAAIASGVGERAKWLGFLKERTARGTIVLCDATPTRIMESGRNADALTFIIAHELAHVIVQRLHLPAVGDAEAVVDQLAAVLLTEAPQNTLAGYLVGHLMAASSFLDWVGDLDDDRAAQQSHHGSAHQRAARIRCVAVGRQPANKALIDLGSTERLDECIRQYSDVVAQWQRLLGQHWHPLLEWKPRQ